MIYKVGDIVKTKISRFRGKPFTVLAVEPGRVALWGVKGDYIWISLDNVKPYNKPS